jgi:Protein of unknown function (DUF664)
VTPDPETVALIHFLDAQRTSVLAIVDGLDEDALRTPVLPSGWSPLGLIEHLGDAERHWFQDVATGCFRVAGLPRNSEEDESFVTNHPTEVVFAYYREQCRIANEVLASTPLSAAPVGEHGEPELDDDIADLRWIALHMIEETARHAGHLDVVRELLDGRTGLGPR